MLLQFGGYTYDPADDTVDREPTSQSYWEVLKAFTNDTLSECRFHAERSPVDRIADPEDFERLPLLTASDLRPLDSFDLLPDRLNSVLREKGPSMLGDTDRIVRIAQSTSSTGGSPKIAFYTRADWQASAAFWNRLQVLMTGGFVEGDLRIFNCFHPGHGMGRYLDEVVGSSGNLVVNRHHASPTIEADVAQLMTGLPEIGGFNCIAAPAWSPAAKAKGASLDLLLNADLDNFIGRNVQYLISAGAPLNDPKIRVRERVGDAAALAGRDDGGPRIREIYGGSEVGIVAASCTEGSLHLVNGPAYTEVVDPESGGSVGHGQRGRIAVTSVRHGSRYLRYLIGDAAQVDRIPCACGRGSARISEVERVIEPERLASGCAAGSRR